MSFTKNPTKKILHINIHLALAFIACFFALQANMFCAIYVDTLFLSTYPPFWLANFFAATVPIVILSVFFISPFLSRATHLKSLAYLCLAMMVLTGFWLILSLHLYWWPYAFCLSIYVIKMLILVISLNTVAMSLNTRSYKAHSKWFMIAGTLGTISASLSVKFFIHRFQLNFFVPAIVLTMLIAIACLYYLKPEHPLNQLEKRASLNPLKISLIRNLLWIVILLYIIETVSEFILKTQVAAHFNADGIADFMSNIYTAINVVVIVLQLFVLDKILQFKGFSGLLALPPIVFFLASLIYFIHPSFNTSIAFMLITNIIDYSINNISIELALNPLPAPVRKVAKLWERGIASSIGKLGAAGLLYLITHYLHLSMVSVICMGICIVWFFVMMQMRKDYQDTLNDSVKSKRFLYDNDSALVFPALQTIDAVKEKEITDTLLMLQLGDKKSIQQADELIQPILNNKNPLTRSLLARALSEFSLPNRTEYFNCLLQDNNPEVVIQAILSSAATKNELFLPVIVDKLFDVNLAYIASRALRNYPESGIEYVKEVISSQKLFPYNMFAKVIIDLSGSEHPAVITWLSKQENILVVAHTAKLMAIKRIKENYPASYTQVAVALLHEAKTEVTLLRDILSLNLPQFLRSEINVRLYLSRSRYLYWYAFITKPELVINVIPILLKQKIHLQKNYSDAIEFLDTLATDKEMRDSLSILDERNEDDAVDLQQLYLKMDPWLKVLVDVWQKPEGQLMSDDVMRKTLILREISLFNKVNGEILRSIAEEVVWQKLSKGDILFKQGDASEGFYMIAQGEISIQQHGKEVQRLQQHNSFGEIGIIDHLPRTSDAVAYTDCELLMLSNITFNNILDDIPDLLRTIAKTLSGYIRQYVAVT